MTTRDEIRLWLKESKARGATHMLVVCDTFDHEDYPVDVMPGENPRNKSRGVGEMQRVMECYSHALDHDSQLAEHRSAHYEPHEPFPLAKSQPGFAPASPSETPPSWAAGPQKEVAVKVFEDDREVNRLRAELEKAQAQLACLREAVMTFEWGTAARVCSEIEKATEAFEARKQAEILREAASEFARARGEWRNIGPSDTFLREWAKRLDDKGKTFKP